MQVYFFLSIIITCSFGFFFSVITEFQSPTYS